MRRAALTLVGSLLATLLASCDGGETTPITLPASPPSTTSVTATTTVPVTPVASGPGSSRWVVSPLSGDERVRAFVEHRGEILALATGRFNNDGFRLLRLKDSGRWKRLTSEVGTQDWGFEFVIWVGLVSTSRGLVVTGSGGLLQQRGKVTLAPIIAILDDAEEGFRFHPDPLNPDGGSFGIVESDGLLIAAGKRETAARDWGPGIWLSNDAITWEPADLTGIGARGIYSLSGVVSDGQIFAAVGYNNASEDPARVLTSTDGELWTVSELPAPLSQQIRPSGIAFDGSEFIISGTSWLSRTLGVFTFWRSTDGLEWTEEPAAPEVFGDGDTRFRITQSGPGFVLGAGDGMHRAAQRYCYDDAESCRQPFSAVWIRWNGVWRQLTMPDGEWSTALYDGRRLVAEGHLDGTGAIAVLTLGEDGIEGLFAPLMDASPPVTDLQLPGRGGDLLLGTEYAYPKQLGCWGWHVLGEFNGQWWTGQGPGSNDPDWPSYRDHAFHTPTYTVYGTIRLVADDLIEYSIPGFGKVAEYQPADETFEPYGCI